MNAFKSNRLLTNLIFVSGSVICSHEGANFRYVNKYIIEWKTFLVAWKLLLNQIKNDMQITINPCLFRMKAVPPAWQGGVQKPLEEARKVLEPSPEKCKPKNAFWANLACYLLVRNPQNYCTFLLRFNIMVTGDLIC